MIIAYLGGVGSGKSVALTKKIVDSKVPTFTNYELRAENVVRLKKEDILIAGEKKYEGINWDFWNNLPIKNFNIAFDEIQNILHSRQSMTKWNTFMSIWLSQIRKILGDSETGHLYCISQKLQRIDVSLRDLMHLIIYVKKYESAETIPTVVYENGKYITKMLPKTFIIQHFFPGDFCVDNYNDFVFTGRKRYKNRSVFLANPYFKYYDSYGFIEFGSDVYL